MVKKKTTCKKKKEPLWGVVYDKKMEAWEHNKNRDKETAAWLKRNKMS
jgi:hypothetical protein